ncbi:MAG: DNA internalization-related competence protein ComEC/Rec2 [Burkholderiales bacterium]|nr:DNA internalization-related competence protein ComEC/Rec2 [Burkholderiales bacterium]
MRSTVGLALVAFACGVCVLQTCAVLPRWPPAIVLAALCMLLAAARNGGAARAALTLAGASLLGFGYAAWRADARLADALPSAWEGADVRVTGIVDDLPALLDQGVRFAFAVEQAAPPRAVVPRRISVSWYDFDGNDAPPVVRAGERWTLTVRLKRPHGNVNPGGFDLEAWLLQHNLRATGYVANDTRNVRVDAFAGRFGDHVQRAREEVRARIHRDLPDGEYAGVIAALAIGDQRAIPEAQWTVFNRTGVGHLVSISGLHVTVFAAFAGGLAFALARRSVRLTSHMPARKVAAAAGLVCAGAYTLLAGAEVPAVRTFAMLAVAAAGLWLGRPGTATIVWLWALAAVLGLDPWAPLTPGFWLSYGAVALLLYASAGRLHEHAGEGFRQRAAHALRESARAQWVVTVGLAPLTLALFGQTSLIAPLANAIAIPAVTLVVVPLTLTGILVPFAWLFELAHAALVPLMAFLAWLSGLPDATWQQHAPPPWTVVAGCFGALWLLAPRGVPARACGVLWLLPLFLVVPARLPDGAFRLTVLDVGQGLAAVVETRQHTLVYDTGPGFGDVSDAGGRIVVPFLRARGLRRADGLIVSHQDLDHAGGALSLLQATPVGFLASSLPAEHPIVRRAQAKAPTFGCAAGQGWTWDGVRFTILHPTRDAYDDRDLKPNDRSCVVRVESAYGSVLLAGDIETRTEALLVRTRTGELRADVLVVPHHGSRTSSSLPFVRAVAPAVAVIGSGYRNRFGHPRADIVARYVNEGIAVARTDLLGAVTIIFDGRTRVAAGGARAERARYWLDRP